MSDRDVRNNNDGGLIKSSTLGGSKFTTKADRKKRLRKKIQKQVGRLANLTGDDYDHFHRRWINEMDGQSHASATEDELQRKLDWLNKEIEQAQANNYKRRNSS